MRPRTSRSDAPEPVASGTRGSSPEQEELLADSVGLALLVVLDRLTPAERLAFVLHDMFAVPFEEIASILSTDHVPAFFFVWTLIALGVTAIFSVILSARTVEPAMGPAVSRIVRGAARCSAPWSASARRVLSEPATALRAP